MFTTKATTLGGLLSHASDTRTQAGGRKFTKFRLFSSCLFGLGQLVLLAYRSCFSYLDGGCSRTRTCDPLIKSQLLWTELLPTGRLRQAEHQR